MIASLLIEIGTNVDNNRPLGAIPWINIAENNKEIKVNCKSVPFFKLSDTMPSIQSDLPDLNLCIAYFTCSTVI